MVKVKPVARKSLVDTVVERIHSVITDGQFGPGERLPTESEWVRQLEVSRTVLREAIGRLEAMGLVVVRGSRGMYVGEQGNVLNCVKLVRTAMAISPRELVKFTEFRRAIECEAARWAAEKAAARDLEELESLVEQIRRDDVETLEAFRIDFCFHRKLLALSGNELMMNVMDVVQEFVMASIIEGAPRRRDPEVTYQGHLAILKAIESRDADAAEKAMRAHMNAVLQSLHEIEKHQALPSAAS